jgi:hypothetical protein
MRTFCPFVSEEEISIIGLGLLDRTLPKTVWTHAAHFAATLWLLKHRPELEISREMPGIIRAYNEATGGANTDSSATTRRLPRPRSGLPALFWLRPHRSPFLSPAMR